MGAYASVSVLWLVFMHAVSVCAFERIWCFAGIATFSSISVCVRVCVGVGVYVREVAIRALCFPYAIKSNGPSSPSEAHSKTTAVTDSCRGRWMQTQKHKTRTQIYLSQSSRTAWLLDGSQVGQLYALKRGYAHKWQKKKGVWLH